MHMVMVVKFSKTRKPSKTNRDVGAPIKFGVLKNAYAESSAEYCTWVEAVKIRYHGA